MVVKIGVMQLKRDASPQHFHLCNDKGDLKGFQINFETLFFTSICHNLSPANLRGRKRGKNACSFLKNSETSLARTVTTMFS